MCISSGRCPGGGTRPVGIRLYIIKKYMILLIMVCLFWFYFLVLCISYMIQWKILNSVSYKFKSHLCFSRAYGTCYFAFWNAKSLLWWAYCLLAKKWDCHAIVIFLYFLGNKCAVLFHYSGMGYHCFLLTKMDHVLY